MSKKRSKVFYLLITVVALVVLSGCSVVDKSGEFREIVPKGFWDTVFVFPVAWLMNLITSWSGHFAIGVVLTTIIIRTIAFPIYTKTNDNSIKMQAIQPEIQKIQAKYAGKSDPESRNKMNMELMQVYKDNNISMLGGCLMPFLQMPIFMAMYHAVARTPVTYGYLPEQMNFFWTSLSDKGDVFAHPLRLILPVLVVITSIVQQQVAMIGISDEAKNNPTMKMMMYVMPLMMFFISVTQVQALSLYWVAGNLYSTLQVIVVKRPFKKKDQSLTTTKRK